MNQERWSADVGELLHGAWDLHVHTQPSHFDRALDDVELARQCDQYGLAGALIKSHYDSTAARAQLVNRHAGAKAQLCGGVALNWPCGGLNPYAVESTLKMGGRIVWMPTRDAENCLRHGDMHGDFFTRPPISLLDESGKLKPVIDDILAVVKKYGAWLATGHVSVEESLLLCREARAQGVNTILTHPDWVRTVMPLEQQLELAEQGVLVEKVWLNVQKGMISIENMAQSIRALGGERVYLVTDLGQAGNQPPAEGMGDFLAALLMQGIAKDQLLLMAQENPRRIALGA